jgi:hypothetical protein
VTEQQSLSFYPRNDPIGNIDNSRTKLWQKVSQFSRSCTLIACSISLSTVLNFNEQVDTMHACSLLLGFSAIHIIWRRASGGHYESVTEQQLSFFPRNDPIVNKDNSRTKPWQKVSQFSLLNFNEQVDTMHACSLLLGFSARP